MNEKAQLWIVVSNREESMARVLSRADLNEGTVLHAHRAASASLVAIFAHHGFAATSDRSEDLCGMLAAHDVTAPQDVRDAAKTLDSHARKLDPESAGQPPSRTCTAEVAASCLDCATRIRSFVNAALTKS